jgi:glycosyltransferase involved in cell wall biosynthesis
MSTTNNYADYVNACDVFVHLSREDSAPQVLELAKQLGKPIVLFEGIGGRKLQDQETSLRVSKFLDLGNLANEIEGVINHPLKHKEVGSYSSWPEQSQLIAKALENFGKIKAPSGVANQSLNAKSTVKSNVSTRNMDASAISVIIPNYNHEKFIEERLHSILNQSHKPAEIIVLDDGSKDNSFQIACDMMKTTTIENKTITNQFNSGSVLRQWEKGILNSKSDWIWIAESDDSAALDLIESAEELISRFNSDLILFESEIIDEESNAMLENSHFNRIHIPTILNTTPPGESLTVEMRQLKRDGFLIRNLFVNVSAIIWRKSYLLEALTKTLQQDPPILVGDWCLYLSIDDKCKVTYCDRSLNQFRRSRLSVRNKSDLNGSMVSSRNFVKNAHFGLYTNEDLIRFEIENLRIANLNA